MSQRLLAANQKLIGAARDPLERVASSAGSRGSAGAARQGRAGARDTRGGATRNAARLPRSRCSCASSTPTRSASTFRSTLSRHARQCLPLSSAPATRRATWHWSANANQRLRSSCSAKATSAPRRATPAPCWRTGPRRWSRATAPSWRSVHCTRTPTTTTRRVASIAKPKTSCVSSTMTSRWRAGCSVRR